MKFGHLLEQSAVHDPQLHEVFKFYKRLKKDLKKYVEGELAAQQHSDAVSGLGEQTASAAAQLADDTDSAEHGEHADSQQQQNDTASDGQTGATAGAQEGTAGSALQVIAALAAAGHSNSSKPPLHPNATAARAEFQSRLNGNISEFREKCKMREEAAVIKLQDLQQQAQQSENGSLQEQQDVYTQLVELHGELLLLLHWGMMVYTALGKILKKQRKKLQGDAPVQPEDLTDDPLCAIDCLHARVRQLMAKWPTNPLCAFEESLKNLQLVLADMVKRADLELKRLADVMDAQKAPELVPQGPAAGSLAGPENRSSPCAITLAATVQSQAALAAAALPGLLAQPASATGPCGAPAGPLAGSFLQQPQAAAALLPDKRSHCGVQTDALINSEPLAKRMCATGCMSGGPCEGPYGGPAEALEEDNDEDIATNEVEALLADEAALRQYSQGELGKRTDAAMHMWHQLVSNVSSPSTFKQEHVALPMDSAKGSNLA